MLKTMYIELILLKFKEVPQLIFGSKRKNRIKIKENMLQDTDSFLYYFYKVHTIRFQTFRMGTFIDCTHMKL